jgi:hypothetical protein
MVHHTGVLFIACHRKHPSPQRGQHPQEERVLLNPYTDTQAHLKVCWVYFTPILDETAVTTTNFFAAIEADIRWKTTNIVWSKASTKGGNWIILPIDNMDDLHYFREKPEVGGKFVVVF